MSDHPRDTFDGTDYGRQRAGQTESQMGYTRPADRAPSESQYQYDTRVKAFWDDKKS